MRVLLPNNAIVIIRLLRPMDRQTIFANQPKPDPIIYRAGWVVAEPETIIQNGAILVHQGKILSVDSFGNHPAYPVIDCGPGIIMPSTVNCHTHLELSVLYGKVPLDVKFIDWIRNVINLRAKETEQSIHEATQKSIQTMMHDGCGIIGDISSLGVTWSSLLASDLCGIWFREYLGNESIEINVLETNACLNMSLAGHAPHTTSPLLLQDLKKRADRRPFSIHVAESIDECEFITTAKGQWANLLSERQISYVNWPIPQKSPVQYLDYLSILDSKTIVVHGLMTSLEDLIILHKRGVYVCVCPRSNEILHHFLPDIISMGQHHIPICIGTDSLACVSTLSIFDEMRFIGNRFPMISPVDILSMGTRNGAHALGLENCFGTLQPGKHALFVYLPITHANRSNIIENIIFQEI